MFTIDTAKIEELIFSKFRKKRLFCIKAGISENTLRAFLKNPNGTLSDTLDKIANALDLSLEERRNIFFCEKLTNAQVKQCVPVSDGNAS